MLSQWFFLRVGRNGLSVRNQNTSLHSYCPGTGLCYSLYNMLSGRGSGSDNIVDGKYPDIARETNGRQTKLRAQTQTGLHDIELHPWLFYSHDSSFGHVVTPFVVH